MSTPVQQDELSPGDPRYYAPPQWRTGEKTVQFPGSAGSTDWTSRDSDNFADAFARAREHSDGHHEHPGEAKYSRVRVTALFCAVGVIAWTAFCVAIGLSRIDTPAFAQLQNVALSLEEPNDPLNERLQAANDALNKVSRQIFAPQLVVADASGLVNAALPLAIKVTNYTPDTTVNLSGLASGTVLSAGTDAGEGHWRVAIDDLPNARVIPPSDYVGPMTVVAELRHGDDQAIVRAPVRLTWSAPVSDAADAVETVEPSAPTSLPDALDDVSAPTEVLSEQPLAQQTVSSVTQPRRVKTRKHVSRSHRATVRHHHKLPPSQQTAQQAAVDVHSANMPFNLFASPNFAFERKQFWNGDFRSNADSNRGRCERGSDCGRAMLRRD
jgi:hypothetical protein